jgi:predicted DNA-binding antitoxin AbrB/MazE fold protein
VKLRKKQEHQKRYDIGSRALLPLKEGERIRVQVRDRWKEATVDAKLSTPRSYNVRTPNRQKFRRNRVHIRKQNDPLMKELLIEGGIVPSEATMSTETSMHDTAGRARC